MDSSSGKINFNLLKESYKRELLECIDNITGSKTLVWDPSLTGSIDLIADYSSSALKERGVEGMDTLSSKQISSNAANIVFIIQPMLGLIDLIAECVKRIHVSKILHLIFVPKKLRTCQQRLTEMNIERRFTSISEYCLDLIPFDCDILSLELPYSFRECMVDKDYSSLHQVAKSLMTIQAVFGTIPIIHGKGQCAQMVYDIMLRMRRASPEAPERHALPQIDWLFLLDRSVDPFTPLLQQLTYEGLIDEIYGINYNMVKVPPEKFKTEESSVTGKKDSVKLLLSSADMLYSELRDKNFNAVGPTLSKKARSITAEYDERHAAKTVGEIKAFVTKLPMMQAAKKSLAQHTSLAELVKEATDKEDFMMELRTQQKFIGGMKTDKLETTIDDYLAQKKPLIKVLRLLCLQSLCNNGLKPKLLEYYKHEILQVYGFGHLITLDNLEKAGLLGPQQQKVYFTIKKSLKLVVDQVNEKVPTDISYVYSGYAPLSVRLAHHLVRSGWRSITDVLNLLPGPNFSVSQTTDAPHSKRRGSDASVTSQTSEPKVVLIFFIGGVTFAEISALRFLTNTIEDGSVEFVIATTKIINGNSWLTPMIQNFVPSCTNPF